MCVCESVCSTSFYLCRVSLFFFPFCLVRFCWFIIQIVSWIYLMFPVGISTLHLLSSRILHTYRSNVCVHTLCDAITTTQNKTSHVFRAVFPWLLYSSVCAPAFFSVLFVEFRTCVNRQRVDISVDSVCT